MPVQPDPSQNFIQALSDFWSVFFKDTVQIESFYKGVEINLGQLYLDLLETVLGTSLQHLPVFSRSYYKEFTVGEDQTFYVEGDSRTSDRYTFAPASMSVQEVQALMNRVIAPTRVLESPRDFDVYGGAIRFRQNIFDVDGVGTSIEYFPVRAVSKVFPAEYRDLLLRDWRIAGVLVGDSLRFRILGGGSAFTIRIVGVREDTLLLETTRPEFSVDLRRKRFRVTALRTPFDATKSGLVLPDHPSEVSRMSANAADARLVAGGTLVDFSAEPFYKGAWAPLTAYASGDVVTNSLSLPVRAKTSHVSGATYDTDKWLSLEDAYFYIHHPTNFANDGLASVVNAYPAALELARPAPFLTSPDMRAQVYLMSFSAGLVGTPQPALGLRHNNIDVASVHVAARRKHPVYALGDDEASPSYPANEGVIENVDYRVDYDAGVITILTGWDPSFLGRISYSWKKPLATYEHKPRGSWSALETYDVGDMVFRPDGLAYVSKTGLAAFSSDNWQLFQPPFSFGQTHSVRQVAFWGTEVLLDQETLYKNFGNLLSFKHPSSEQYRAFLRGVSQLFVLGPALERFESALNVMANLPVIRDDGEVLRAYDDGIYFSGSGGSLIDSDEGRDGTLTASGSTFSSPGATFLSSDVGARIRVSSGGAYTSYNVISVTSPTQVVVSPTPPNATGLSWSYTHVALTSRFRAVDYAFTTDDQDALILISGASNARNNGTFRIEAIENASTVILENSNGFTDEAGLSWRLSRRQVQSITTSRTTYELPLSVEVRPDIALPASVNTLTFEAFEPISDAFQVTDYLQDPTWWHNIAIPDEVAKFAAESAGRRHASPDMVEHRLSPLDNALVGDFGLRVGADEEGRPGLPRSGPGTWYGGDSVVLNFSVATPKPNARDVGKYATVTSPLGPVQFRVLGVDTAGTTVRLENFPPPELREAPVPQPVTVTLAPLLYRRTVGFVMMDRFLKYHALRVTVAPGTPLPTTFIGEATQLLKQAKPAYTHVYLESPLAFLDQMLIDDSGLTIDVGVPKLERVMPVDNTARVGPPGLIQAGDAFVFLSGTQTIPASAGTYTLTPTLPSGTNVRFHAVKGWFDLSVTTSGRRLAEGVDYTFDRAAGAITVLAPGLPAASSFNYVVVILQSRTPGTLNQTLGETALCVGGADPTSWWALGQTTEDAGLIDRAVQLTIGP